MIAPEGTPQRSLPAPLWKKLAGIWSLVAVFVAAVWLWPDSGPSRTPGPEGLRPVSCDARASGPRLLTTPIEEIRVFDWLVAENPYGSSPDERVDAVDWLDWRVLSLRILKPDGSAAEIELARPLAWVESQEATLGGEIWLDLPEMGISGWAEVHEIRECPDPGRRPSPRHWLVTATFKHTSDQVVRLQVSGEAQSLGVTASHPIWSVDRREFVEVGALDRGERVLGLDGGEHLVAAVLPRPGPTALYNLEVYGAHVYHVGASGLLAHNMCAAERAGKGISSSRLFKGNQRGSYWASHERVFPTSETTLRSIRVRGKGRGGVTKWMKAEDFDLKAAQRTWIQRRYKELVKGERLSPDLARKIIEGQIIQQRRSPSGPLKTILDEVFGS